MAIKDRHHKKNVVRVFIAFAQFDFRQVDRDKDSPVEVISGHSFSDRAYKVKKVGRFRTKTADFASFLPLFFRLLLAFLSLRAQHRQVLRVFSRRNTHFDE